MNSPEFKDTVCRICLDEIELFDWKNKLEGHGDVTYKDCYYKYTQLEPLDADPFSTMLCQNCLQDLQSVHEFILKALESYNFLLKVNGANSEIDCSVIIEEVEAYDTKKLETVLVEKTDTESAIEDQYEFKNSNEEFVYSDEEVFMTMNILPEKTNASHAKDLKPKLNKLTSIENEKDESGVDQSFKTNNSSVRRSKRNVINKSTPDDNNINTKSKIKPWEKRLIIKLTNIENKMKESKVDQSLKADNINVRKSKKKKKNITNKSTQDEKNITTKRKIEPRKVKTEETKVNKKTRRKYNKKGPKMDPHNTPCMCSICSRILHSKYALQKHGKTHIENRERKVPCPICGVKFFDRANVVNHMHIHDEKREKKHKCEFCGKAKGVLNVHLRVHLGKMLSCTLCGKQFYRQIDLDIHMNRHSAIAINGVTKKRSRYLVQCQYCDKQILSTNYKAHAASHLNQPLVKCLICDKEFFSRGRKIIIYIF